MGKAANAMKVKPTIKVSCWVPHGQDTERLHMIVDIPMFVILCHVRGLLSDLVAREHTAQH